MYKLISHLIFSPILIVASAINLYAIVLTFQKSQFTHSATWCLAGFVGGLVFFKFIYRFDPLYVFGHELAHWLAAKICRRKTGKFKAGLKSGSVEVHNPNTFIMLAPYFFPTSTFLLCPFYFSLGMLKFEVQAQAQLIFFTLIGISLAHHIYMNVRLTLLTKQSDFDKPGKFYSVSIIFFANTILLFFILSSFTPQFKSAKYIINAYSETYNFAKTYTSPTKL